MIARTDLLKLAGRLRYPIQLGVVAVDDERHPRQLRVFRRADRKALDVESPRRQHPGNVREYPRLIHDQRRQNMSHAGFA